MKKDFTLSNSTTIFAPTL